MRSRTGLGVGLALGVAIGVSLGMALHNWALGIAIGLAIGVAFSVAFRGGASRPAGQDGLDADAADRGGVVDASDAASPDAELRDGQGREPGVREEDAGSGDEPDSAGGQDGRGSTT